MNVFIIKFIRLSVLTKTSENCFYIVNVYFPCIFSIPYGWRSYLTIRFTLLTRQYVAFINSFPVLQSLSCFLYAYCFFFLLWNQTRLSVIEHALVTLSQIKIFPRSTHGEIKKNCYLSYARTIVFVHYTLHFCISVCLISDEEIPHCHMSSSYLAVEKQKSLKLYKIIYTRRMKFGAKIRWHSILHVYKLAASRMIM